MVNYSNCKTFTVTAVINHVKIRSNKMDLI